MNFKRHISGNIQDYICLSKEVKTEIQPNERTSLLYGENEKIPHGKEDKS